MSIAFKPHREQTDLSVLEVKERREINVYVRRKKMWMYVFGVLGKTLSPHCWNMNVRFKCLLSSKKKGFVEKRISYSRKPACGFF